MGDAVEFGWSEEDVTFRKEVRAFLDVELGDAWRGPATALGSPENVAFCRHFAGALARRGWLTPHWPVEHGGSGASAWRHTILGEELWSIGEPRGPQYMNVNWIGPSIMAHGTEAQKRFHLPRIARGEVIWCQGFSEPDAGSDLGALRTSAVRDADVYVVNGQKVWTSYAAVADFCYLLVRTAEEQSSGRGITVLLVPTDLDGFEVRSVGSVVGDHAFHELFLTDVQVPVDCRLGPENQGWDVVRQALAYERVGAPRWARAQLVLEQVAAWARDHDLLGKQWVIDRLGEARAATEAARLLFYRVIDERALDHPPTPNANLARIAMVDAERLVGRLAADLLGADGLVAGTVSDDALRRSVAAGIAAGTYEIQLNMIARLLLGLPKG
jgi:alkylation response protein AidB-like acyl-CoA dehydrogenase